MAAASSSLKEYLKKYESSDVVEKKKKKKKPKKLEATGVLVVDEDPIWQKPVTIEEKVNDSEDEDKPQVDEDIEVKRMKRLEQVKVRRPFGAISEDGSGWIPVSNAPQIANLDDHDTDMSPPRKRRSRNDTPSPDPEAKPSSTEIADLSPPRQWLKRYHSPLPETENKFLDSDQHNVDMSPPRRRRARYDTPSERDPKSSDLSPPRRQSRGPEPDLSPPRQVRRRSSNQGYLHSSPGPDLSPPRKSRRDLSPPRKNLRETTSLSDRPKTGLVTGKEVKDEIMKTKKDEYLRFKAMDPSVTGLGAEAVYRDKKTGKRLSKDEVLKSQQKEEKPKEVKLEWGKGLAQKREAEARQQELECEKEKPFARTRDDADLDRMLKDRVRWGDPMAHLVKRKKPELALPDIGDDEKMKASGFIIPQDVPNHSWLKRGLDAAPNRYGIKPGRHWDGVDRSTGFEKSMFKRMNEKQATEREAYLWSVADM